MKQNIIKSNIINKISYEAEIIFAIFNDNIRLVGGAVRNLLLEKNVSDYDFATPLLPDEILNILDKNKIIAIPTGLKYGTITAVINNKNIEITTLRKDIEHQGRDCNVEFVDSYLIDASRRDFTINALYLDHQGLIHDYFGGVEDLKNSQVRFIGNANQRINEDYLRILRFFRFSCEYSSSLDDEGLKACIDNKNNLKLLAKERIRKEFLLILSSKNSYQLLKIIKIFNDHEIVKEILPITLDYQSLESLFILQKELNFNDNLLLIIAIIFLHEFNDDVEFSQNFLNKICATNAEKKYFYSLINILKILDKSMASLILGLENDDELEFLFSILKEIMLDNRSNILIDAIIFLVIKKHCSKINLHKIILFFDQFKLPEFPLNGDDLIALKFKGSQIATALNLAKKFWLKNNFNCEKSQLINYLKKFTI